MQISERGIEMLARFEGGESGDGLYRAYWDSFGRVWTIGIGETEGVHAGMVWTREQAYADLRRRMASEYEPAIAALGAPLNQNQWDALCDFVWNLGPGSMQWDVGRYIRERNYLAAGNAMLKYDVAGGQVLSGLRTRREAERALFLTPDRPPPPPDPYAIFDRTPRSIKGMRGKISERQAVETFDRDRRHPRLNHVQIAHLKKVLTFFRKRVWYMAHREHTATGWRRREHPDWGSNHKGKRYQELAHRTR